MSTFNYSMAELPGYSIGRYTAKAVAAGYTNVAVGPSGAWQKPVRIAVSETVDRSVLRDNIVAALEPALAAAPQTFTLVGDGVASQTVTVTDSRGAEAQGATLRVTALDAPIKVSPPSAVLDANGSAVFVVGPSLGAGVLSGSQRLRFDLADGSARPVVVTMRFGP